MPTENVERKLAAILSADVKGYSRLMGEDEVGTLRTLTAYRRVIDSVIDQHWGRIVGTAGDSVLAEFASAVNAVRCALAIQQELRTRNADLPSDRRMEFRIGINVGDVIVEGPQIYGDGVNIAARLEAIAEGGGVCLSGTVYDQVENKLTLGYEDLGEQSVKNIAKPVRVYRVIESDAIATTNREEPSLRLPLPDKPSIIVLPFVNMSGDPTQEYFSDGLTEDLTSDLSKISSLFVISRNSAFTYKGKAVKVRDISREMGVRYVVEGSVRWAPERIRVTVQLIDATTDYHLWAERYDRPLTDIFALQDEIVQKIVTTLKLQLTLWEQGILVHKGTNHTEAYDCYLRGIELSYHYGKEAHVQARQILQRAVELDPQYATAYAWLGWTYWIEWVVQWSQDPGTLEQAFALAQTAIDLDESLSMAHQLLGRVYQWKDRKHEQAIAELERAIALHPNNADAYVTLADILSFAGKPKDALALIKTAMRLNPRYPSWYLFELGFAYRLIGRYEEAIEVFKQVLLRTPGLLFAHTGLAATYSQLGRHEEARAAVAEILRLSPNFSLEIWKQRAPYKDPAALERYLAALRQAGLK